MGARKLSLVVPCFNEAACIGKFVETIFGLGLENPLEIVFVDDGSRDDTLALVKAEAAKDARVRYVSFSRNFGKEAALFAGLKKASGELVATMDADLQHRPELLLEMAKAIEDEGYDCAAACRTTRSGEPKLRSWFAHRFYALMSRYSDVELKDGSMDYRMMTRQVVDVILTLGESNRFTKGIYQWVGFRTKWIETTNVARVAGETKWSFWSLFAYSIRDILAFSTAPLQMASVLGVLCCLGSFAYMAYVFVKWALYGDPVSGWPTLICVVLLLGGLQLFVIGVLGLYIAGIFREVKNRPIYIAREEN